MDREVELREFVSARGPALSRAAFLLTGDHQAAEDLVQETCVVTVDDGDDGDGAQVFKLFHLTNTDRRNLELRVSHGGGRTWKRALP